MRIPIDQISAEALRGVAEEFVTREGTEYGDKDVPLDQKVAAVLRQLDEGTAVLLFDPETGTCTLAPADAKIENRRPEAEGADDDVTPRAGGRTRR